MGPQTVNINISENVLIEQCRMGDSDALGRLIVKYQDRIYNAILRICGNPDTAAELTQDTFVKIIENLDKFRHRSSFYTWAFRIAVNLTLNYCRSQARVVTGLVDGPQGPDSEARTALKAVLANDKAVDPAQVAQSKEQLELILSALGSLDDSQRTVLVLRDIEGMNYAQIAFVLGIQLGTVKSRLSRARGNLRKSLKAFL